MEILEVKTEDRNGLVHVALMGELDLSTVAKVQEELRKVEADAPPTVVVDLSRLTFLDSTGLRCIVTADERARDEGRRVVIVRGPGPGAARLRHHKAGRAAGDGRRRRRRALTHWFRSPLEG